MVTSSSAVFHMWAAGELSSQLASCRLLQARCIVKDIYNDEK